jgi:hypothetical protein
MITRLLFIFIADIIIRVNIYLINCAETEFIIDFMISFGDLNEGFNQCFGNIYTAIDLNASNIMTNEEHRLEKLEPEPEPGEPRLEILEA